MEWISNPWVWLLIALVLIGVWVICWLLKPKRGRKRKPGCEAPIEFRGFWPGMPAEPDLIVIERSNDDTANDDDPDPVAAAFIEETFNKNGRS